MSETKPTMNVQDGLFNTFRKERRLVFVYLINGKRLIGRIQRFDRYALVLASRGKEALVYKHAIASVMEAEEESPEDFKDSPRD